MPSVPLGADGSYPSSYAGGGRVPTSLMKPSELPPLTIRVLPFPQRFRNRATERCNTSTNTIFAAACINLPIGLVTDASD